MIELEASSLGCLEPVATPFLGKPLGYGADEEIRLFPDIDLHGDVRETTLLHCHESVGTRERCYSAPRAWSTTMREGVVGLATGFAGFALDTWVASFVRGRSGAGQLGTPSLVPFASWRCR